MGVDITTNLINVRTHYNWYSWRLFINLAIENGWKQKGTEAPLVIDSDGNIDHNLSINPEDWDGSYLENHYQHVTAEDAQNIAIALETVQLDKVSQIDRELVPILKDFIRICRHGGFYIG